MDFTLSQFNHLLLALLKRGYHFLRYKDYQSTTVNLQSSIVNHHSTILFRHDVDRLPQNALQTAKIEYELGIKGTYYFRIVPKSYNIKIMQQIANLGHEIGYHYEDLDLILKKNKILKMKLFMEKSEANKSKILISQLIDLAYESFCKNLEILRQNFDIKTICMHGSPLSPLDNKLIWTKYNYKKLGILGEPYLDIDWTNFEYYTDTGRRWNSNISNVRDKVQSKNRVNVKNTKELIKNIGLLSDKLMINIHPERWSDNYFKWVGNFLGQNLRNIIKMFFKHYNVIFYNKRIIL